MECKRFARLTLAFSKKLANLKASVALHYAHYNFVRIHRTLRMTPAMAAGVTDRLWSVEDLLEFMAQEQAAALSRAKSARAARAASPSMTNLVSPRAAVSRSV